MTLKKIINFSFLIILIFFFTGILYAFYTDIFPLQLGIHPKVYKSSNVGMEGYDLVNYFQSRHAKKGNSRFNHYSNGVYWNFMSKSNKKNFVINPTKYIPQFGGFCAYSISEGYTYPPDPKVWKIINGKLYFFRNEEIKKMALYKWESIISKATLNWE